MTSPNQTLANALLTFCESYTQAFNAQTGHLPLVEHDSQWLSPCETSRHDETYYYWQPVAINAVKDQDLELSPGFDNVELALDLPLHEDIKTYFTTVYSSDVEAKCDDGALSLLFAWNRADFDRLQQNIIGHIMMKQRLKQTETIFFAVTDEEDIIISVNNSNGEVWVERVGCKPHKKLSDSLALFISQLTPNILPS
jgi:SecY interacting protein Syd